MKRIHALSVLCLVAGISGACSDVRDADPAPRAVVQTDAQVAMDLGREFCGGCVDGVRKTLAMVPGIGAIDYTTGAAEFVVHYDSKQIDAARILELVRSGGEAKAQLRS